MNDVHSEFSVISLVLNSSGGVQFVMLVLFIASMITWKLIFEYNNKIKNVEKELLQFNISLNGSKNIQPQPINTMYKNSKIRGVFGIYKVFLKSFKFIDDSSYILDREKTSPLNLKEERLKNYENELIDIYEETFKAEMELVEQGLKKKITILGTISSTSPYIGLMGTVYGILIAFWGLGLDGQATIAVVAPSIAEALIATGMGLFVAIPSLIGYNRLNHRVDNIIDQYEQILKTSKLLLKKNVINISKGL